MQISYLTDSNSQLPDLRYQRILVVNNIIISCEFWTYKENEQLASINKNENGSTMNVVETLN